MLNSNTLNHLTVCKQMTYQIELFVLDCHTWNDFTLCKQIINEKKIISVRLQYVKPFKCTQTNGF